MSRFLAPLLVLASAAGFAQEPAEPSADLTGAPQSLQPLPIGSSGKCFFWLRMWPDWLVKFDPETDETVGKVQFKNGLAHGMVTSYDKKRFFVTTAQRTIVEVIELASLSVVEEHSFKEDGYIVRVDTVKECPGGTQWYVKVNRIKSMLDHYVVEEPQWLLYRVADKEVEKRMKELPKAIRTGARISPDGKKWHVFSSDLVIVDPVTLKEEGRVELSRPLYSGMGGLLVRGEDFFDLKNPDGYRLMYTMRDPVLKNRTITGLVDVDLKGQKVAGLKEWGADVRPQNLQISRDKKIGVAQSFGGRGGRGRESGENEITLITYDLEQGKKVREVVGKFRNGLSLSGISPDGKKAYLTGRGHELVILGEDHLPLRTIEFSGELDGRILTIPE